MSPERKRVGLLWLHGIVLLCALLLQLGPISPVIRFCMVLLALSSAGQIYFILKPRPRPTGGIVVVGMREYRRCIRWGVVAIGWLIFAGAGALVFWLTALVFSLDTPGGYALAGAGGGTLGVILMLIGMLRTPLHELPSLDVQSK